ncbi:MAG: FtsB family cell division protein [Candidatus Brocadiales bacterium]
MHVSKSKRLSLLILIGIGIALVAFLSYKVFNRYEEHRALSFQQEELQQRLTLLEKRNSWLKKEKNALLSDPVRIEREARNQLGYTRPEEIPYKKYRFNVKE